MKIVRGLLDRLALVAGVLVGGVLPSFMAQYRQRIGGQLAQVLLDLAPFQQIANLRHRGSLDALIQHHLNSADATFQSEGAAIKAMADSALRLREAAAGLDAPVLQQLGYLLSHPDPDAVRATWEVYAPSFGFSVEALGLAAATGIGFWLVFHLFWMLVASFGSQQRTRPRTR